MRSYCCLDCALAADHWNEDVKVTIAIKRNLGLLTVLALVLAGAVSALLVVKSYVWPLVSVLTSGPSNSLVIPATKPVAQGAWDFSKLPPRFKSTDFQLNTVILDNPNGRIASEGGVYFIESSPGTFWVWNRPWRNLTSNFACEVVGRVASSSEGAWSLFLTNGGPPPQGIKITLHGNATLEIGPNSFADSGILETHIPPFKHPAIKAGTEFNRLLIVFRDQELAVFVNGTSVCEPLHIQQHVLPGVLALSGSAGPDEASRVEFTSCTVWRVRN